MARIRVAVVIDAPVRRVWNDLRNIGSHVEWMEEAVAIHFEGAQRQGVGTAFVCETRVGPLRTADRMEIVEWRPRHRIGVRHTGVVTGTGRFTLRRAGPGRTRFTWDERLSVPWRLGGPLGALVAAPFLRRVWRTNLSRFARRF